MIVDMDWLRGRTVSLVGLHKNAGKTTALNALLGRIYAEGRLRCPALTSIGRDGESIDVVTGTDKPGIFLRSGTLVATAAELLPLGDFTREILASTGVSTPLGEVYILRALSGGAVQLGGPSMTGQLRTLKEEFFRLGADCVLIDGAAGRLSLSGHGVADGVILCCGAGLDRSPEKVAEATAYVVELMTLPRWAGENDAELLSGAVTDKTAAELLKQGRRLAGKCYAVEDASRLMLSEDAYRKLTRLGACFVLRETSRLLAVALNPVSPGGWRFNSAAFRRVVESRVSVPVTDVREDGL